MSVAITITGDTASEAARDLRDLCDLLSTNPVVESPPEPVVESLPEPVVEEPPEPVVEEPSEPVVEEPSEPVVEEPSEPVVEESRSSITELLGNATIDWDDRDDNNEPWCSIIHSGKVDAKNRVADGSYRRRTYRGELPGGYTDRDKLHNDVRAELARMAEATAPAPAAPAPAAPAPADLSSIETYPAFASWASGLISSGRVTPDQICEITDLFGLADYTHLANREDLVQGVVVTMQERLGV